MQSLKLERKKIPAVAAMITRDIRQRGLKPGDRYLSGQEVADLLGISPMMANRAMQLLQQENLLERRRKAGTFIGAKAEFTNGEVAPVKCVHLLMPDEYFRAYRSQMELTVTGLHSELPDAAIQYTFLPPSGELPFVRQLVEQARARATIEGVVLHISSPEVQRFFHDASIPTVVFGSVYPEVSELPWIDRDQVQIGQLLAEYLMKRGHKRIAVFMRDRWGYGDNRMIDGVQQALAATGAGRHILIMRSLPSSPQMAAGTVRKQLAATDRPTGLICRSQNLARVCAQVAGELGMSLPGDLEIAVCDPVLHSEGAPEFACALPAISQESQGAMVARVLKQLARKETPEEDHIVIPVRLHDPYPRKKNGK